MVVATVMLTVVSAAPARATSRSIGHVFVINLENENFAMTWGPGSSAPYLSATLRSQGLFLSRYYGVAHHSLPDYVAQISGQGPTRQTQADCTTYSEFTKTGTGAFGQALGDGCVYPASVVTLADQLDAAGLTWKAYQEDIANAATGPSTCRHPKLGAADPTSQARRGDQYTTRHNPFMYFHSVIDSPTCTAKVVGLDALTSDLAAAETTPTFSYITPNLCHDGHDDPCVDGRSGGLAAADKWLRKWVPKILRSPAFRQDGMLVITFDEAENDARACCGSPAPPNVARAGITGPGGGRVGALVLSPLVTPGSTSRVPYNHYSLLCSIEDIFGLTHLGYAAQPGLTCFGADVFGAT
jgi:phosphatidylinositol-3-phosphatase